MRDMIYLFLSERAAWGQGGGGSALPDFFLLFFPSLADHERDWPPCKVTVVFSDWQPIQTECERKTIATIKDELSFLYW